MSYYADIVAHDPFKILLVVAVLMSLGLSRGIKGKIAYARRCGMALLLGMGTIIPDLHAILSPWDSSATQYMALLVNPHTATLTTLIASLNMIEAVTAVRRNI